MIRLNEKKKEELRTENNNNVADLIDRVFIRLENAKRNHDANNIVETKEIENKNVMGKKQKIIIDQQIEQELNGDSYKNKIEEIDEISKATFICTFLGCNMKFEASYQLMIHHLTHPGDTEFKCNFKECKEKFVLFNELQAHFSVHFSNPPYNCETCHKACDDRAGLLVHRRSHTKEKPFICTTCNAKFSQVNALIIHVKRHMELKTFVCSVKECEMKFVTRNELLNHSVIRHKLYQLKVLLFTCEFKDCGLNFVTQSNLSSHQRIHLKYRTFKCTFGSCQMKFMWIHALNRHEEMHENERKYICYCGKRFNIKSLLTAHQKVHCDTFQYHCTECGYPFRAKRNLQRHIDSMHSGKVKLYEKKDETRIADLLTRNGIPFDHNTVIDYCASSNSKHRAFPDFTIQRARGIIILEVDQHAHYNRNLKTDDQIYPLTEVKCEDDTLPYSVSCEQSRMCEIVAALRLSGEDRCIAFLRYNHDNYKINGIFGSASKEEREATLIHFIHNWGDIETSEHLDFEIHYSYYDSYTLSDGTQRCTIWDHKDYSEQLKSCVFIVDENIKD
jgi:hypothetical protein